MLHAKFRNRTCQGLDRQGQGQGQGERGVGFYKDQAYKDQEDKDKD